MWNALRVTGEYNAAREYYLSVFPEQSANPDGHLNHLVQQWHKAGLLSEPKRPTQTPSAPPPNVKWDLDVSVCIGVGSVRIAIAGDGVAEPLHDYLAELQWHNDPADWVHVRPSGRSEWIVCSSRFGTKTAATMDAALGLTIGAALAAGRPEKPLALSA